MSLELQVLEVSAPVQSTSGSLPRRWDWEQLRWLAGLQRSSQQGGGAPTSGRNGEKVAQTLRAEQQRAEPTRGWGQALQRLTAGERSPGGQRLGSEWERRRGRSLGGWTLWAPGDVTASLNMSEPPGRGTLGGGGGGVVEFQL